MRVVRVYGELRRFLGRASFLADVASPAEAIRFLLANFPGLEAHMAERHYKVWAGSATVPLDHLHLSGTVDVIRIAPTVAGAGSVGKVLIGAALIGLSLIPGIGPAISFGLLSNATAIGILGGALILSGVSQALTPTPRGPEPISDPKKAESFNFSGITNISRQGLPVPVIYGETIVGSIPISAGADVDQVAV